MRLTLGRTPLTADRSTTSGSGPLVGIVDGALSGPEKFASLAAVLPQARFEVARANWFENARSAYDLVVVGVDARDADAAAAWLRRIPAATRVIIVLRDADVTTSRRLLRDGAADVLPAPVSEAALALSLERLFGAGGGPIGRNRSGRAVALLKAGGGVGATSLGVQAAAALGSKGEGPVCFADLDIQFGCGAIYLDLPDAMSVTDALSVGASLADTPFASALAKHSSGVRLLASPREMVAVDTLAPAHVDALLRALRRDFPLTLFDLPSVWNEWTSQAVQSADQLALVTHLTVPHIQQVKRQLRTLTELQVDASSAIIVCNAVSSSQLSSISVKAAERALGREFDVVIPEDGRTMTTALNQGVELSTIRRGTKLEKAIEAFAARLMADATASKPVMR